MRDAPAKSEARLLVVDDEPTILELLAGTLRFAGFDVLTAVSGTLGRGGAAGSDPAGHHDARRPPRPV
jgi:two-component system OmpR family response regulator